MLGAHFVSCYMEISLEHLVIQSDEELYFLRTTRHVYTNIIILILPCCLDTLSIL